MTQPAPPPPGSSPMAAAWPLEQRLACCRHQPNLGAEDTSGRGLVWAPSALLSSEHSEAKPIHVPASGRCPVIPVWPPPGSLLPPFLLFPAEEALETRPCWGWCLGHLWGQEKEGACSLPHARHRPPRLRTQAQSWGYQGGRARSWRLTSQLWGPGVGRFTALRTISVRGCGPVTYFG